MTRIIVMEDDEVYLNIIVGILENAGYEAEGALNGKIGMQLFSIKPADLIVTDLIMPIQDGVETIGILKDQAPEVKIIAMSAGDSSGGLKNYSKLAVEFGADAFLEKPVNRNVLIEKIEQLLR